MGKYHDLLVTTVSNVKERECDNMKIFERKNKQKIIQNWNSNSSIYRLAGTLNTQTKKKKGKKSLFCGMRLRLQQHLKQNK